MAARRFSTITKHARAKMSWKLTVYDQQELRTTKHRPACVLTNTRSVNTEEGVQASAFRLKFEYIALDCFCGTLAVSPFAFTSPRLLPFLRTCFFVSYLSGRVLLRGRLSKPWSRCMVACASPAMSIMLLPSEYALLWCFEGRKAAEWLFDMRGACRSAHSGSRIDRCFGTEVGRWIWSGEQDLSFVLDSHANTLLSSCRAVAAFDMACFRSRADLAATISIG